MSCVHAIQVHRDGGPEELRYETIDVGSPGPGEARVRHTAIGLNFTDIHHRTGRYPVGKFPHGIGMEAAGVVEAVGDGVTDVGAGDRVAYVAHSPGTYAQARIVPASRLIKLPNWLDDETAAAGILKGLTAQYLLRGTYDVKRRRYHPDPCRGGRRRAHHGTVGAASRRARDRHREYR